jgi:hypothetical protein
MRYLIVFMNFVRLLCNFALDDIAANTEQCLSESSSSKTIPRNTLTPELYFAKKKYNDGGSEADESESSSSDDSDRNRVRGVAGGGSESDSDWTPAGSRKTLKRKHRRRAGDTDSGDEDLAKRDDDEPVATYERKFTFGGELMADSWVDSNLSDAMNHLCWLISLSSGCCHPSDQSHYHCWVVHWPSPPDQFHTFQGT